MIALFGWLVYRSLSGYWAGGEMVNLMLIPAEGMIIFFIIIGASILIYNSVTSYDHVMLVRSLTITAAGGVMLLLSYISGSYIRYFTKKERNAIYKLLQETTHAVNH